MKKITCLFLLISSLLFHEVVSNDSSFLQMEILESYTADVLKVYETVTINRRTNATMAVKKLFIKMNSFINSLDQNNVNLRFDTESISFSLTRDIPRQIHDDLNDILIAAKHINEFFASYYVDFLDGYYTMNLIRHFIYISIYPALDSVYTNSAKILDILSHQSLEIYDKKFFDKITNKLNEKFNQLCKSQSTRQQFLISLYSYIIKTQFRAFIMFTSAYKLNYLLSDDLPSDYLMYISQLRMYYLSTWNYYYLIKIKLALAKTSTEYYDCQATHRYNYQIQNVYAIELSPTIVDYKKNKVVTGIQLELRDGFLSLILYDETLLKNGKISTQDWDSHKNYASHRRPFGYSFPENREFDYKFTEVQYVHKDFWKNISFLQTQVPENHFIIGANFEVLQFHANSTTSKKILYIRLHCAKVNMTTGQINASNIVYTKVWTKDDPELQQHPEIVKDYSFRKNVPSIYNRILVNMSNSSTTERWRREPPLTSYVDSKMIQVYPPLPVTSIGLWKNKYGKDSNHLSLKISTMNISFYIKHGS